ncbi:MAG: MarR family winged helix-turn-helix transcriptional regulator [Actinomycetota bacterium]
MPSKPINSRASTEPSGAQPPTGTANIPSAASDGPISYLIYRTAKSHRMLAGTLLRPLNLHPGQELLLQRLWDRDRQTQSQLIVELQLDASTVTRMVQRLEHQGLITREPSKRDQRAVIVKLTRAGRALKPKVATMWAQLELMTISDLTEAERNTLTTLLEKVLNNLANTEGG